MVRDSGLLFGPPCIFDNIYQQRKSSAADTVYLSANVICRCSNTLFIITAQGRRHREQQNTSWSVFWPRTYVWTVRRIRNNRTVCSENELAYDFSIQTLRWNALDIHRKHTASHLHVAACVALIYLCGWISSDKCHMWTNFLHCVTSTDVPWAGNATQTL